MPNTIELFKQYVPLLDEAYKTISLTAVFDGAPELVSAGANADELVIPIMEMDGLADYSRNSGYVDGDVTLTNETVKCNFDRGRMFTVDTLDNAETAGISFGRLSGEFIRTKVAPEVDAFRFAQYASIATISKANAELATGEAVIKAIRTAYTKMNNDEVPETERYLCIDPTLRGLVDDMDTTKSKAVMAKFAGIIEVPTSRFYTKIEQTNNGFKPASGAQHLNFMIIHKPAVIQFTKHRDIKVIEPSLNQSSDGWKFGYRLVGIAKHYQNKTAGIYAHTAPAAV